MEKKKIAILFGGCSSEYEVSLQSAYGVISHVDRMWYDLVLVGLHRTTGQWFWYRGNPDRIAEDTWCREEWCTPVSVPTDKRVQGLYYDAEDGRRLVLHLDLVLPVLHGKNGEDGTVQGALSLAGIPLAGCSVLSSALSLPTRSRPKQACPYRLLWWSGNLMRHCRCGRMANSLGIRFLSSRFARVLPLALPWYRKKRN